MFSSLLRPPRPAKHRRVDRDSSASPGSAPNFRRYHATQHATADFTEADDDDDDDEETGPTRHHIFNTRGDDDAEDDEDQDGEEEEEEVEEEEDPIPRRPQSQRKALPVLPLFSASHLDTLPVYSITHSVRIIVSARTETTLTWDQLRSPQISQFLVKPMQQQIRTQHFSRSTLYALMANCLQFTKEGQMYAANAGISNTRAKVCELLALKILKEYSTRELIDALSYDFYPLQGLPGAPSSTPPNTAGSKSKNPPSASRTSTLEVAIRASAKHFLAHPVVVQQLEAIWSGAITFYSAADSLHRNDPQTRTSNDRIDSRTPLLGAKEGTHSAPPGRRTVSLYDPRQASIMKLSRLRVPRYRSFLSTLSLAVLIGLFLAVLSERSVKITGLELVFWFWSAGFMLDELVGFNEQGFALYIMSFWNIFDLGILVLLIAYYCMRVYGVFLADPHHWNDMAYDVLAANAILLLPRVFSVLDHYQYFSQLLIAFRLMAVDLMAVFTLVAIVCSGFFVFFTLSNTNDDASEVAYKIFQIVMGFTPAAWDVWPTYNWLARMLMVLFLIICHFLVVVILITVLTNSFMAIASNANEEHQFLFAINTISMVKNDALFSYIAPSNIFAWLLMPLRYCMPLQEFVWLNRVIIKATHFPVLFCIYLYERFWLASSMYEPTDLVENPNRGRDRTISFADVNNRHNLFSPNIRVREESVAGFQKDRALEEVFRRTPDAATLRTQRRNERHKAQTAIRNWMDQNDDDDGESPGQWPLMDSGKLTPEWGRRRSVGFERTLSNLRKASDLRSAASDPADITSNAGGFSLPNRPPKSALDLPVPDYKDHTDADGDDELVTNDEDEDDAQTNAPSTSRKKREPAGSETEEDYFTTPMTTRFAKLSSSHGSNKVAPTTPRAAPKRIAHHRTLSTNTILFNPEGLADAHGSSSASPPKHITGKNRMPTRTQTADGHVTSGKATPARRSSPRRTVYLQNTKPRPILPPRGMTETGGAVSRTALLSIDPRNRPREMRRLSSVDLSVLSDNTHHIGDDPNAGMAGSFQTQMAMAMMKDNRMRAGNGIDAADRDRMGRLVLARMKTLEESFADVVKEMRDLKYPSTSTTSRRNSSDELKGPATVEVAGRDRGKRLKGDLSPKKPGPPRRPLSRRSIKEPKFGGMDGKVQGKGKGKDIYVTSDDEPDTDDQPESQTRRSM